MNTNKLIDKIIELSKENGSLKKENEILKKDNKMLQERIKLNDFVDTMEKLLDVNKQEINRKATVLEKEENVQGEKNNEPLKINIVTEVLKKGLFNKK